MAAALVRTIFAQPDARSAWEQLDRVVASLKVRFPRGLRCFWRPHLEHVIPPGTVFSPLDEM